ncbi:MAG: hypothetical protein ACF8OB_06890 [Phycisphaeraceae bacterium JB051]
MIVSVFILLLLAFGLWISQNQALIVDYHFFRLEYCRKRILIDPQPAGNGLMSWGIDEKQERRFLYHRKRLVELGALNTFEYKFIHIKYSTPQSKELVTSIKTNPLIYEYDFVYPDLTGPVQLTLWCYPKNEAKLKIFLTEKDQLP